MPKPTFALMPESPFEPASLDRLTAFGIGHAQNEKAGTGCTVVLAPQGGVCGVDVRGGGPATRETDLLKPENMIQKVHAVVLSGGSAFGLESSCGVMEALAEHDIGFKVGEACVPIVTGACLFDLLVGENAHPDKSMGRAAAEAALDWWAENTRGRKREREATLAQGNVGAGCGASVGKLADAKRAMKSGFGWACLGAGGLVAAALVAVNALGCVCDGSGAWIAGVRDDNGGVLNPISVIARTAQAHDSSRTGAQDENECEPADSGAKLCENTTIGVVITNAKLTKAQATKAASTVHDAYARAIKPVHTANDGDTVFAFASGEQDAPYDLVAVLATEAMQKAIVSGVAHAKSAYGLIGAGSLL